MLDPCAGRVQRSSNSATCSAAPATTYAIELDDDRARHCVPHCPRRTYSAPANFFGCRASFNSFSFIWLNPPFDDSYGSNRVEDQFLADGHGLAHAARRRGPGVFPRMW